jgi:hypothetical protein
MFPLWDVAIAPVLHAAQARRIVEIGAWRGETTDRMLGDLGPTPSWTSRRQSELGKLTYGAEGRRDRGIRMGESSCMGNWRCVEEAA